MGKGLDASEMQFKANATLSKKVMQNAIELLPDTFSPGELLQAYLGEYMDDKIRSQLENQGYVHRKEGSPDPLP